MKQARTSSDGAFRFVLVLGAIASVVVGVWGLLWTQMLSTVLGFGVPAGSAGLARVYGAAMVAVGIGYALAAAQPHRNRSLLVPLLMVPLLVGIAVIAAVARHEVKGVRGSLFAAWNFVYCLLYFRLYPRVPGDRAPSAPTAPAPGPPPPGPST